MEPDITTQLRIEKRATTARNHLRKFGAWWVTIYVIMTGWLFHALTGNYMTNPIIGNTFIAMIAYAFWTIGKHHWRKSGLTEHSAVRIAATWVSEVAKER